MANEWHIMVHNNEQLDPLHQLHQSRSSRASARREAVREAIMIIRPGHLLRTRYLPVYPPCALEQKMETYFHNTTRLPAAEEEPPEVESDFWKSVG